MKVLVIGGGGREHALAWKLKHDEGVSQVFVAPGNAGTARDPELINLDITDKVALREWAQARVHGWVAAALARGHRDFTDDACPDLSALFVLATLAVLNVCPFAVSGHEIVLLPAWALI